MGKRAVLTNDRTLTSEYRSIPLFDFLSCAPSEKVPDYMFSLLAPNVRMDNGILGKAPYGLRKIEVVMQVSNVVKELVNIQRLTPARERH